MLVWRVASFRKHVRQIVGFLHPGDFCGLTIGDCFLYAAEAVTRTTVLGYRRSGFDQLVDNTPGLARRLLTAAANELSAAQDQMLLLGRKTAAEKIAPFLLMIAEKAGDGAGSNREVSLPMLRTDIADYLGLTMETVSRVLSRLRRQGLIELPSSQRILILDQDAVEELAEGEKEDVNLELQAA